MTQKAVRAILTIIIAATPLALITGVFISHDVIPKTILVLTGAALLLVLLPSWAGDIPNVLVRGEGRLFLSLVIAQAASLLLSTLFSTQPALSFAGTVWRRLGSVELAAILVIATALACTAAANPAWIKSLLRIAVVCGGFASIYGILQYFNFDPFLPRALYTISFYGGIVRPPATMGHAIYYAAYLVPIALIAASLAQSDTGIWKWIHGAIALASSVAIVLSGTRGSLLALLAGGAVFAWKSGSARMAAIGAGVVVAAVGIILLAPVGANLRHRLTQWREDLGGPRLEMWRESPAITAKYPVFGSGPETFAVEFRRIESAELSRAYPEFYNETPHNAFLDAATAQGIPGLIILAGVFWVGRRSPPMIGMLAGSMFASFSLVTAMYLWCLAGLEALQSPQRVKRKALAKIDTWRIPAALVGAVFATVAVLLCVQDASYAKLRDAAAAHDLPGAIGAWDAAVRFSVGMPGYELWASRQMASLGVALTNKPGGAEAWKKAAEAAALAETEGEERFSAIYQSSILAIASSDLPRAEAKAREAIDLAPNWYKPHLLLAQILQAAGKNDLANQEARVSADLGWKPN